MVKSLVVIVFEEDPLSKAKPSVNVISNLRYITSFTVCIAFSTRR